MGKLMSLTCATWANLAQVISSSSSLCPLLASCQLDQWLWVTKVALTLSLCLFFALAARSLHLLSAHQFIHPCPNHEAHKLSMSTLLLLLPFVSQKFFSHSLIFLIFLSPLATLPYLEPYYFYPRELKLASDWVSEAFGVYFTLSWFNWLLFLCFSFLSFSSFQLARSIYQAVYLLPYLLPGSSLSLSLSLSLPYAGLYWNSLDDRAPFHRYIFSFYFSFLPLPFLSLLLMILFTLNRKKSTWKLNKVNAKSQEKSNIRAPGVRYFLSLLKCPFAFSFSSTHHTTAHLSFFATKKKKPSEGRKRNPYK